MYMHIIMHTQLKNFIQKAKFDPSIDDNYFARSQESTKDNSDDLITSSTAKYILSFYSVGFFLVLVITLFMLFFSYNTKQWDIKLQKLSTLNNANKYTQAKILSVSTTIFLVNLYAVILDSFALYSLNQIKKESDIQEPGVLSAIPYMVAVIDTLAIILWISFCIMGLSSVISNGENVYIFFAISTLGPTLSLVLHLPYILIAYLNDASYASSMFILYTIMVFILFGALDVSYSTCIGTLLYCKENPLDGGPPDAEPFHCNQPRGGHNQLYRMFQNRGNKVIIIAFSIIIPTFILLIVILMGMITAALVVIPINRALSDAPNRLWGFYQIVIILVGAYFIYKKLFVKKPSIETVVEESDENIIEGTDQDWRAISNEEKLSSFYKHIMTIIAKIDPENNNIRIQQQQQWQQQQQQWQQQQQQWQQQQQQWQKQLQDMQQQWIDQQLQWQQQQQKQLREWQEQWQQQGKKEK